MKDKFLIYGVTGYTGALITKTAIEQGLQPLIIIGGRNSEKLAQLGQAWQVEHRVFSLDNPAATQAALQDVKVVLNCAGPFAQTALQLAQICLQTSTHYLDIAGEVAEFQAIAALDKPAQQAGVMLMPGVGFGVVPTDCLAVYLAEQMPAATSLTLAFQTIGGASRGTVLSVFADIHKGGVVRQAGSLTPVPAAWKSRPIDFGAGAVKTVTNPWRADLVTAYYSTHIPNIETYTAFPTSLQNLMKVSRYFGWLLGSRFFKNFLQNLLKKQPAGPTEQERANGKAFVWGEVSNAQGAKLTARLQTPEAYATTALTALAVVRKVLAGKVQVGFRTPAQVYGADFILEIPGVVRTIDAPLVKPVKAGV